MELPRRFIANYISLKKQDSIAAEFSGYTVQILAGEVSLKKRKDCEIVHMHSRQLLPGNRL